MRPLLGAFLLLLQLAAPLAAQTTDPLAPGEHEVEVRGVRLWYLVRGSGPALVLQPGGAGWGGDSNIYIETLEPLESTNTVVYLEPRGIGRSGRVADPALYTMDEYVEDVEALRRHLGLDRLRLAGHSHGGFVALTYALVYPERVERLVLLNSGAFVRALDPAWMETRPGYAEAQARLAAVDTTRSADEVHAEFIRALVPALHFHQYEPFRGKMEDLLARTRFSVEPFRQFERDLAAFDLRDRAPEVRTRTLIVIGDDDMPDLMEGSFLLHERMPRSQLLVTPGCGHWPMIECPNVFFPAVRRFLSTASSPR
jgi:proline iminopeptidase